MRFFVDRGIDNAFYWGCYVVGFAVMFVFNIKHAKNYKIPKAKAFWFSFVSYVLIYAWAYILAWIINGFEWGHHNAIRVFAWMPLVLLLTGNMYEINWRTACDYIAPGTCLVYGIARLGCNFTGCCFGIPASWGIYSCQAGNRCIPVQLFQTITSIIIFFIVLFMAKSRKYKVENKLYPSMLIMYGGARFLLEFLRDREKLFLDISELALWSLLCIVMGVIWLVVVKKKEKKIAVPS